MTTVMEEVERADEHPATIDTEESAAHRSPLLVGLFVLLAALIGFGVGWLAFRDGGVDVASDVDTLIDDYEAAWEANDGDAVLDLMTVGGTVAIAGQAGVSGEDLAAFVETTPPLSIEDGDIVGVFGETTTVVVKSAAVGSREGYGIFHIVDQFGLRRIASYTWVGA